MKFTKISHPDSVCAAWPEPYHTNCEHYVNTVKDLVATLEYQNKVNTPFDITFDLEDSNTGEDIREVAHTIMSPLNMKKRTGIRIVEYFDCDEAWRVQLTEAFAYCVDNLSHVSIPKAESAGSLKKQAAFMMGLSYAHNSKRFIPIRAIIETREGVENVNKIAKLDEVTHLGLGILDFVDSYEGAIPLCAASSPGQWQHELVKDAKVRIANAAHNYGVIAIHNQTLDLIHPDMVYNDAMTARNLYGFHMQYSVHPNQIDPILHAMTAKRLDKTGRDEVQLASFILAKAQDNAWVPVSHMGELYGTPAYRYLWRKLKAAYRAGEVIDQEALRRFFGNGTTSREVEHEQERNNEEAE